MKTGAVKFYVRVLAPERGPAGDFTYIRNFGYTDRRKRRRLCLTRTRDATCRNRFYVLKPIENVGMGTYLPTYAAVGALPLN